MGLLLYTIEVDMVKVYKLLGNEFEECTYVLYDETGEAVIIDCGLLIPGKRSDLIRYIEDEQLRPVRLLMTHAHHDHAYGNDLVHDHYGLLPEVHEADMALMTRVLPERIAEHYKDYPYPIPMPEHYLADGEVITFGNHSLQVIHVPGHSPGSVVFYCAEAKIAFTGDTLMKSYIGNMMLMFGSPQDMCASLRLIVDRLPDDTVIYPGHYGKATMAEVKAKNEDLKSVLAGLLY